MQLSRGGQTLIRVSESDIVDGSCQIPASITAIGTAAFYRCVNLKTLSLSAGITAINAAAFLECIHLKTITLPVGVTAISATAFGECRSLEAITLPAGVTAIGSAAFSGCVNLKTLTLPASIKSIGDIAFLRCNSLALIIIASDDETEIARITHLLPEELRSKVISKRLFDEVTHFQERQLARLLSTPQTNRLYRFFHDNNLFMSKLVEKNEAGQAIKKACIKLPDDIFWHINEQGGVANPYYQQAQVAIKREPLPKTTQEFERYKERLDELVTQYIVKAMEQAQRFSMPKTPRVANEEVTVSAPAV
ncbi:leucine-rich repeat domain-containing protein [Legionella feeleii]|uniref:Leucine-rich repeat domain-containing protein n=1 Tax=Legionella feeleii TaxID=453 RepID=A0A378IQX8_9GAMM|nr:leucine-rich repeat domain-containing protein [Legionella feeleii]STX37360.1 Uncharacterised protein [Legionella feeleii]